MSGASAFSPVRIARLVGLEWFRLKGRKGPLGAFAGTVAATLVGAAVFRMIDPAMDPALLLNGWGCLARSAGMGLGTGMLLLVLLTSQSVAGEAGSGALRSVLLGPVSRAELIAAKTLWSLVLALVLHAVIWAVALLSAVALFGLGDVIESIRYGKQTYLHVHRHAAEMWPVFLAALGLSLPPLAASALLGTFCSVIGRRPAAALTGAVLSFLGLHMATTPLTEKLAPWLFVRYGGLYTDVLRRYAMGLNTAMLEGADIRAGLVACAGAAILFVSGSFLFFGYRDFQD